MDNISFDEECDNSRVDDSIGDGVNDDDDEDNYEEEEVYLPEIAKISAIRP